MHVFHNDAVSSAILFGGSQSQGSKSVVQEDISRVLVIYTGGTIGMKNTVRHGYLPVRGYLTETLRSFSRFHSPPDFSESPETKDYNSEDSDYEDGKNDILKNDEIKNNDDIILNEIGTPLSERSASDVSDIDESYFKSNKTLLKSTLKQSSKLSDNLKSSDSRENLQNDLYTLTNKVNVPIMSLPEEQRSTINVREIINGTPVCQVELPSLITPPSLFGKRIRYSILEYDPLLDSSNMTMSDWVKICTDIEINYTLYDAFIILHGTDTMSFTASALSFMLEDLGKTVILTGSQVPLSEVRNDAVDNLLGALTIAGHYTIPEVGLFFANKLFRGNRSSKMDATDFNAFDSPNLQPLVHVGINIDVNWNSVLRPNSIGKFKAHKRMVDNVATLRIFPGITGAAIKAFLQPPLAGVVLETYGSGNAPNNRKDILDAFKEASDNGVVIVNCTQCKKGLVTDLYATGKALLAVGIVPGFDMTPECALTKLSYLLGKSYTADQCRALMRKNLRGELTIPVQRTMFSYKQGMQGLVQSVASLLSRADNHDGPNKKRKLVSLKSNSNQLNTDSPIVEGTAEETSYSIHKRGGIGNLPAIPDNELSNMETTLIPVLLCYAASIGEVKTISSIIEQYADSVNASDYSGRTALHVAASEGRPICVKYLLEHGANVYHRDNLSHSALWGSMVKRHIQTSKILIDAGAHLTDKEIFDSIPRLVQCIEVNDFEHFKLWASGGLDVLANISSDGTTALHLACRKGLIRFVKYIVKGTLNAATALMELQKSILTNKANRNKSISDNTNVPLKDDENRANNDKLKDSIKRRKYKVVISKRMIRSGPYHSLIGTVDTSIGCCNSCPTSASSVNQSSNTSLNGEPINSLDSNNLENHYVKGKTSVVDLIESTESSGPLVIKNIYGYTPLDDLLLGASQLGLSLQDEVKDFLMDKKNIKDVFRSDNESDLSSDSNMIDAIDAYYENESSQGDINFKGCMMILIYGIRILNTFKTLQHQLIDDKVNTMKRSDSVSSFGSINE